MGLFDDISSLGSSIFGHDTSGEQKAAATASADQMKALASRLQDRTAAGLAASQADMQPALNYSKYLYGDWGQTAQPQVNLGTDAGLFSTGSAATPTGNTQGRVTSWEA